MFFKQLKVLPNVFPLFAHVDTGLLVSEQEHFKLRLMKLSNGGIRVTKDNSKLLHVTSMAIKSGTRYVDELATIEKANILEAYIDAQELEAQKKETKVKASFKIEINEEEKVARDSTTTNVYHTGLTLSEADKKELEMDRL